MTTLFKFSVLLALLGLAGCGDLMGKKVQKKKIEAERFRADCELDVNAFTDILQRNIGSDIRCLQENLNLFIKVVKTDRQGFLSREALEAFVIKNRPEIKPELIRAMKAVFDLNFLVTGEDPEYISKENVDHLVDIAVLFNEQASLHYKTTFNNTSPAQWDLHQYQRGLISNASRAIVQSVRKVLRVNRGGNIHKLNIYDLLDAFTTEDNRDDMDKVKKVMFVKKVILGGSHEEITHLELERALLNLEPLLLIALDGVRYQYLDMKQDKLLEMLKRDISEVDDILGQAVLGNRDEQVLFTLDEAEEAVKLFVDKDDFDVEKFSNVIREAKKMLMGGNLIDVKGRELKTLMNHGKTITKSGVVFHNIYEKFKPAMEAPNPVTVNFSEYQHTYPNHQKELKIFDRIVKKYRFMKGKFDVPYFTSGYRRNADGIFEIYLLEYLIQIVFKHYGSPSPNADAVGGYSMDQFQMKALFKKFEKDLISLDLLSPLWPTVTADNVSLLGTLFQYQSDKNAVMDVNEAAEFGVSLIAALGIRDSLMDHFRAVGCKFDEFDRIEPACVRKQFFVGLCKGYKSHFPLFHDAIGGSGRCEDIPHNDFNTNFLERSIEAARPCRNYTDGKKEEIWFTSGDIMTMMMVFIHAETTVLRWDVDKDNILQPIEVGRSYEIYSPALDGFLETKPAMVKRFKRQIFQYMIKFETVPDDTNFGGTLRFLRFLLSFRKASSATRKTITSVLKAIGDENKKLPGAPTINCNLLRDPENLPENPPALPMFKEAKPSFAHLLEPYKHLVD